MADIGFHATAEDERIIRAALREGERPSDVIRRALRVLHREMWRDRVRAGARRSTGDLSGEH
ncbi:hypothetical protein E1292_25660 [Nonomuraea deserti]|uniref:CopG family transcriptional regulator n=1 Tax=Nonomuraea deserti TaxID=1848322 RepID=A0A4R4VHC5_9ACTN|nr:hypothetical protein [Nonomuraea deserti]TDD01584.1 hypothetical protein E1292_25660 [Nonomuraea deserti]